MTQKIEIKRGVWFCIRKITPKQARKWLKNTDESRANFRRRSQKRVEAYVRDSDYGDWGLNLADNIIIGRDPETGKMVCVNGQHRLAMIVDTGRPHEFPVMELADITTADASVVDQGFGRSVACVLGGQDGIKRPSVVAQIAAELYRQIYDEKGKVTVGMVRDIIQRYGEAIVWATRVTPGSKRGVTAPMRAALARGFYHFDPDRLALFPKIFAEGPHNGYNPKTDRAADVLRNQVFLRHFRGGTVTGQADREEYYKYCESAVWKFGNRKQCERLRPVAEIGKLLPLPK